MTHLRLPFLIVVVLATGPSLSTAEPILDQFNVVPFSFPSGGHDTTIVDLAQTFTVGLGGILSRIELNAGFPREPGSFDFQVRPTVGGAPTQHGGELISGSVAALAGFGGPLVLDIASRGLRVVPGDVLAIALHSQVPGTWLFEGNVDSYPRGMAFRRFDPAGPWETMPVGRPEEVDFIFKTFVDSSDAAAIPEPSTLLLLATGTALIGRAARRRRANTH